MTSSDVHAPVAAKPPDPPDLNYVPARREADSGPMLGLMLFLLALLIWLLSARPANAQVDPATPPPPAADASVWSGGSATGQAAGGERYWSAKR